MALDLHAPVTQERFADLVGVSQQAISDLVTREMLPRGGTLKQWLLAYCENLREQAAGRAAKGDLALVDERAKLTRSLRELRDMEIAVKRRELAPVEKLRLALEDAIAHMVGILDGLPGALKRRLPVLTSEDLAFVTEEVGKARTAIADVEIEEEAPSHESDAGEYSPSGDAGA